MRQNEEKKLFRTRSKKLFGIERPACWRTFENANVKIQKRKHLLKAYGRWTFRVKIKMCGQQNEKQVFRSKT